MGIERQEKLRRETERGLDRKRNKYEIDRSRQREIDR